MLSDIQRNNRQNLLLLAGTLKTKIRGDAETLRATLSAVRDNVLTANWNSDLAGVAAVVQERTKAFDEAVRRIVGSAEDAFDNVEVVYKAIDASPNVDTSLRKTRAELIG